MCFVSNVSDFYGKTLGPFLPVQPNQVPNPGNETFKINWPPQNVDLHELRRLIGDFKQAMEAAKKLDILMKQPDCVDPEKAKLQERVAELEAKLKSIQEAAAAT